MVVLGAVVTVAKAAAVAPAHNEAFRFQRPIRCERIRVRMLAKARKGPGKKSSSRKQPGQQTQAPEQPSLQVQQEEQVKSEGEVETKGAATKNEEQIMVTVQSGSSKTDATAVEGTNTDAIRAAAKEEEQEELDALRFGSRVPELKEEDSQSFVEAVLDEARRISWPPPQKVAGQTGAVVGIVALGAATLLIVNSFFSNVAKVVFVSPSESRVQEIRRKKEEETSKKEEFRRREENKFETFKIEKDKELGNPSPSAVFPDILD